MTRPTTIPSGRGRPAARSTSSGRGEGRLKAIFWTAVLILFGYACYKIVPAFVADYQLQEKMQEQARFATVYRKTDEQIREEIFREIQDLEIPASREDIKIVNTGRRVVISVDYTVPVDLLFYHTDLHFTPASENKSLL